MLGLLYGLLVVIRERLILLAGHYVDIFFSFYVLFNGRGNGMSSCSDQCNKNQFTYWFICNKMMFRNRFSLA
ncbi:hypothetical protein KC19_2G021100 [Ceratodon purpureus]|uniref:Uncharacterized protein n=1 Tax=Ceratodon purpureus TaxID=3225 RepID=A0A8T0IT45_CERPU|nr:hypothetical protein KC19_2G021100 [Ceratodon purpureus]